MIRIDTSFAGLEKIYIYIRNLPCIHVAMIFLSLERYAALEKRLTKQVYYIGYFSLGVQKHSIIAIFSCIFLRCLIVGASMLFSRKMVLIKFIMENEE